MKKLALPLLCLAVPLGLHSHLCAEIQKFKVNQPGTRNFGVWRLTNDSAIRDEANYHNTQCWSHNGRYTCYTHWGGNEGPGGKASAEIHIIDLKTGEDRFVEKGISPRWANNHNWLFFCHWTGDGKPPYETGTQVIRYDADTGKKVVITFGMEAPYSLDSSDTWLYGSQRYRGQKPEFIAGRVRNQANSRIQNLPEAPNRHAHVHANPVYPIVMVRAKDPSDPIYGMNRGFFDLDGTNVRIAATMGESGHMAWSGGGKFLLMGNRQYCGRPWNKPFPSDLVTLAYAGGGDVCPCGKSGRYICGGGLIMADTRSGDVWTVIRPHSAIIYPMAGDYSTLSDIDPKGSPDGTKIHYHSTRDLEGLPSATVTKYDRKHPDIIHVDSTEGFSDSGDIVARWEVIGYSRKTETTFEGLTRNKYGTRPAPDMVHKVRVLLPLSAFILTGKEKERVQPNSSMVRAGISKDNPLLYQRQTNCYIVVARLPDRPHLRMSGGKVQLIPGESHWETQGYRLFKNGKALSTEPFKPGAAFEIDVPGEYTASAVEWSGLESQKSLPLRVQGKSSGMVFEEAPKDFSWTTRSWQVDGKTVTETDAMKAPQSTMELMHLHDGRIATEKWQSGRRATHVDYNGDGKPLRFQEFENEKLKKQVYKTPDGVLSSEEFYGPDGFKTEYIKHDIRPARIGRVSRHWWYKRGRPVKVIRGGKVIYDEN
ncbi:MAG: hypothetical protein QGF00_29590 [Planctomycetota bacterium]|jgi:hypothetical protein|nr:hypothetical protein [Planctomycetota bacterium]MDP7253790.1 hypothetical protein [Planctomycetota bacterium]